MEVRIREVAKIFRIFRDEFFNACHVLLDWFL